MDLHRLLDDDLTRRLRMEALAHPAQVTVTARPHLRAPLFHLHDQTRFARRRLTTRLKPLDARRIGERIAAGAFKALPPAPEIVGARAALIRPAELPQGLVIRDAGDFVLDLDGLTQNFAHPGIPKHAIRLENCRNFVVRGGHLIRCRNGLTLQGCRDFAIRGLRVTEAEGYGVILWNCTGFELADTVHVGSLASGIYCLGETSHGLIRNNTCLDGRGYFNWDAAIHINHCSPELTLEDIPERSHEDKRIVEKTLKPSFLFVENNHASKNRAQGIYCEGVVTCSFSHNVLADNNKEGICFDWGSTCNFFVENTLTGNGIRGNLTEAEIDADFIRHHPMLEDGSSSCKLPGLSIDNGAVNIIAGNRILRNHGGGVKMVRTGLANLIACNAIMDNALGRNEAFPKFNGIAFWSLGAGPTEFDPATAKLDFYPSVHNLCTGNVFRVDPRDQPVFCDPLSEDNTSIDNVEL
ncbi:MAG: right-handed parallel beta-helix repeat-containing protein [Alphaproteobacteria bacterium]|nr:MAG: right-handed parallel beta-helix repeat-containing protein [Alphaproteobacteria bacterium]